MREEIRNIIFEVLILSGLWFSTFALWGELSLSYYDLVFPLILTIVVSIDIILNLKKLRETP